MAAVIATHGLTKRYGKQLAVHDLNLRVDAGQIYGLIGPNGAGKTTVLRMLVDILRPTAGNLTVLGVDPRRAGAAVRQRIGYLPGEINLRDRVPGRTLLNHLAQLSGPIDPGTIEALAERLGLDLSRPVRDLSKGNKQKLGLIQAFMHRPELLILDEPTSGLDPLIQREFLAMVGEAADAGQTVVLSSHILSEIQHAADEVAVLADGRIVAEGDVASLRLRNIARLRAVITNTDDDALRRRMQSLPQLAELELRPTGIADVHRMTATVRGEMDAVIKALAEFTVQDLAVEEPDLEESILALYSRTDDAR